MSDDLLTINRPFPAAIRTIDNPPARRTGPVTEDRVDSYHAPF